MAGRRREDLTQQSTAIRGLIVTEVERDPASEDFRRALQIFQVSLPVNLSGSKLAENGVSHHKFKKQGDSMKALVRCTADFMKELARNPPGGFTVNSASGALPNWEFPRPNPQTL